MSSYPDENENRFESDAFDIVIASDFALPGGTASCIIDEIKAQAGIGYRTGLFYASFNGQVRPFHRGILRCLEDGLADLIVASDPIRTKLLVIRHPRVLPWLIDRLPEMQADRMVLVVNQVPVNEETGERYYDLASLRRLAEARFGGRLEWMPESAAVRAFIEQDPDCPPLAEGNWVGFLDLDEWSKERTGFPGPRPVIGRHSRNDYRKWPGDRETLLALYPDDPALDVRILGGAKPAEAILGGIPSNWTVTPFGGMPPKPFLDDLDFYVFYHYPGCREAFSHGILEALANGAVTILSPEYAGVYGDACLYAEPAEVRSLVERYFGDWPLYKAQSERGVEFVRRNHSVDTHRRRLEAAIGPPSLPPANYARSAFAESPLLVVLGRDLSANAIDESIADLRNLGEAVRPVVLTMKHNLNHLRGHGWLVESLADLPARELPPDEEQALVEERLDALIGAFEPSRLVALGKTVVPAAEAVVARHPELDLVSPQSIGASV
jgi:hypothetical protein